MWLVLVKDSCLFFHSIERVLTIQFQSYIQIKATQIPS